MGFLQGLRFLSVNVLRNKIPLYSPKQRFISIKSCILEEFDQSKFADKPLWFKKFKMKQAAMQKDDGRPVYLKAGTRDKILYNLSVLLVLFGFFNSLKVLYDLDKPYRTRK